MKSLLLLFTTLLDLSFGSPLQSSALGRELSSVYHSVMDDYDNSVIPINEDGKPLEVRFGLGAICLDFCPSGVLKGHFWVRYIWNDSRLAFTSNTVKNFKVNPAKLWRPDITLYNRANPWDDQFPTGKTQSNALVYSNGKVLWVPSVYLEARCASEPSTNFWGEHHCNLKFGSWTYDGLVMEPNFYDGLEGLDLKDYQSNCPIKVTSTSGQFQSKKYDCCEEPYPSLTFNVTVQRQFVVEEDGSKTRNPFLGS